jgi:N-acetylmuramoyl-L-alanine amidase
MIYICAGHTNTGNHYDPGAVANGFKESALTAQLRDLICTELKKLGCTFKTDKDEQTLNQTIFAAGTNEKDIVFDIHFNAASPQAGGCETFIPIEFTEREKRIAKEVTDTTCKIIGIPNRGVKLESQTRHKRLGMMRPAGTNMLWEVCFITNKDEMTKYLIKINEIAVAIAMILKCADEEVA